MQQAPPEQRRKDFQTTNNGASRQWPGRDDERKWVIRLRSTPP
jgi:hypothetical protein